MDSKGTLTIGSHSETMVVEEQNISNSKTELENKYKDYLNDNQTLTTDWQGDTADVFAQYSQNMNCMLGATIRTTGVFGTNINTFYLKSQSLDTQASLNIKGEE